MLSGPLEALAVAFGVVFVAEFGDKTQLMVLAFATRYRALPVILGVVVASALVMAASVAVGTLIGTLVSTNVLQLIGGLLFLGFAAWTLLSREENGEDLEAVARFRERPRSWLRAALVVGGTFMLTELGDKSMLATLTLATQAEALATWAGASLALIAASLVGVVIGRQLGTRIPRHFVRYLAAALFALFGFLLLAEAVGLL